MQKQQIATTTNNHDMIIIILAAVMRSYFHFLFGLYMEGILLSFAAPSAAVQRAGERINNFSLFIVHCLVVDAVVYPIQSSWQSKETKEFHLHIVLLLFNNDFCINAIQCFLFFCFHFTSADLICFISFEANRME